MTISASHQHADGTYSATQASPAQQKRVDAAFKSARRHSGRVRVLKFVLPVAAVCMVLAFGAKSWLSTPGGVSVNLAGTAIEGGRLVMADPKLDGFTSDNRAYKMSAARAIQDIGNASKIDLEGIDARLPFDDDNWMTIAAATGIFDRDANRLDINSDITVMTDNGITALLKSASVDIAKGSLNTQHPVDITLDGARIEADSMTVKEKGAVMIFDRRVRMNIDGKKLQTAARAEGVKQ
ncbi:LPS export ABC transporter periplasmic protein LptC [Mesorhizobium sp. CAU 1732]|uniref:LPS export ABC transporter periplasmic protein LptC n=1 Tax=Mesorhizobium sp. CAU 1732 TaxID=3140358 RepID=UPI0032616522